MRPTEPAPHTDSPNAEITHHRGALATRGARAGALMRQAEAFRINAQLGLGTRLRPDAALALAELLELAAQMRLERIPQTQKRPGAPGRDLAAIKIKEGPLSQRARY